MLRGTLTARGSSQALPEEEPGNEARAELYSIGQFPVSFPGTC